MINSFNITNKISWFYLITMINLLFCSNIYCTPVYLDTTFGSNGTGIVIPNIGSSSIGYAIALQTDNKIIAAGQADSNGILLRYNTDGTLDTGFGTAGIVTTPNTYPMFFNSISLQ